MTVFMLSLLEDLNIIASWSNGVLCKEEKFISMQIRSYHGNKAQTTSVKLVFIFSSRHSDRKYGDIFLKFQSDEKLDGPNLKEKKFS